MTIFPETIYEYNSADFQFFQQGWKKIFLGTIFAYFQEKNYMECCQYLLPRANIIFNSYKEDEGTS